MRCLQVVDQIKQRGVDIGLYQHEEIPQILVLSKRYDDDSLAKAISLKSEYGTTLILDICDNHFFYQKPTANAINRYKRLKIAISKVDLTVASSTYLSEVIKKETQSKNVVVISDLVDFPHDPSLSERLKSPVAWCQLKILQHFLNRCSKMKAVHLVWFGSHGGGYADCGMASLNKVRKHLENWNCDQPISLTIISNSWTKYKQITRGWHIPTFYLPWNKTFFSVALSSHELSIIPIQLNPFTMAKTANRITTSLVHGLTVVADEIPSYAEFASDIRLGKWASIPTITKECSLSVLDRNFIGAFKRRNSKIIEDWQRVLNILV